jgi:hypothetical protein
VKRKAFSGKGFMHAKAEGPELSLQFLKTLSVLKKMQFRFRRSERIIIANEDTKVINHEQSSGKLDLKEAEIVVSAGRGMKGPENWGMIEDLANVLEQLQLVLNRFPISDGDLTQSTLGRQEKRFRLIFTLQSVFPVQFSIWRALTVQKRLL